MKLALLATASVFALGLAATPADAAASRQQCWQFQIGQMMFDCDHDNSIQTEHPETPRRPDPPDDPDDDDDTGDDDDGGCEDPKDGEPY